MFKTNTKFGISSVNGGAGNLMALALQEWVWLQLIWSHRTPKLQLNTHTCPYMKCV